MIAPRSISQMISASSLEITKAAIVAELGRLLVGVKVIGHPGKLDINDVVSKSIVTAPGVAVGWTRVRADRQVAGAYNAPVEWAAYIVAEDFADIVEKRSISKETVGHAIGTSILDILNDPDVATWGVEGLGHPLPEPAPALVPMFTIKSMEGGVAIYAVTWTQAAWDEGKDYFSAETPELSFDDGSIDAEFDESEGLPTEIRAMLRQAGSEL